MCEEGEGELHAGVEEQVEEVRRADLLQLCQLRGRHRAGQAREPELVLQKLHRKVRNHGEGPY